MLVLITELLNTGTELVCKVNKTQGLMFGYSNITLHGEMKGEACSRYGVVYSCYLDRCKIKCVILFGYTASISLETSTEGFKAGVIRRDDQIYFG